MSSWRAYQEEAAKLFRELGCEATVEAVLQGARSKHKIDVWVVFKRFGYEHRWVVECKNWKTSIPKEKVLTLKSIVEDVGANQGLLIAESGFQSGAITAAEKTNIILTTLAELRTEAKADLCSIILERLEQKAAEQKKRLDSLYSLWLGGTMNETDSQLLHDLRFSLHFLLRGGFNQIRGVSLWPFKRTGFPAYCGFDSRTEEVVEAATLEEFIDKASGIVEYVERELSALELRTAI